MTEVLASGRGVLVAERPAAVGQPSNTIRLALVQSESRLGTETEDPRDANMERALEAISQAADAGVPHVIDEIADIARTIDEHRVGGFTRTLPLVS